LTFEEYLVIIGYLEREIPTELDIKIKKGLVWGL